jgi:hypothetical protein
VALPPDLRKVYDLRESPILNDGATPHCGRSPWGIDHRTSDGTAEPESKVLGTGAVCFALFAKYFAYFAVRRKRQSNTAEIAKQDAKSRKENSFSFQTAPVLSLDFIAVRR